ncbi:MAG: hypothetical protein GTN53_44305 [Candidatus Aminicenantes bacterium]|nr:hypothetical protein [Candidatus Aminicenantes bacterium]NIQ73463.1 hypothetical protein [Candidatus Aminicenantes bacterium]NIT29532.1 hypothetical protein [Candidatus Aminicenantes bacterium]
MPLIRNHSHNGRNGSHSRKNHSHKERNGPHNGSNHSYSSFIRSNRRTEHFYEWSNHSNGFMDNQSISMVVSPNTQVGSVKYFV